MTEGSRTIGPVRDDDVGRLLAIINAAAEAYKGIIPADRWRRPYMPDTELRDDIADGVRFLGWSTPDGVVQGVIGTQDRGDVTLLRHAYVDPEWQRKGVGSDLLAAARRSISGPVLVGTWRAATWAIAFYRRHGFERVPDDDAQRMLRRYWAIPTRQAEASVVLADSHPIALKPAVVSLDGQK